VTQSTFVENSARDGGGLFAWAEIDVSGTTFLRNDASGDGGAIAQWTNLSDPLDGRVVNSVLADNTAGGSGGGLFVDAGGTMQVVHNTIARSLPGAGHGVYAASGTAHVTNTIVVSHTVGVEQGGASIVHSAHTLYHGNGVDEAGGVTGVNPLGGDPAFVDPGTDDYRLTVGSAAIDAGMTSGVGTDADGAPRPLGYGLDVGAYEYTGAVKVYRGVTLSLKGRLASGSQISLTVPSGGVSNPSYVAVTPVAALTGTLSSGLRSGNVGFVVQVTPIPSLQVVSAPVLLTDVFQPLTLTVVYEDVDVADLVESSLKLVHWDPGVEEWVDAAGTCVPSGAEWHDPGQNTLGTEICATGEYALVGAPADAPGSIIYLPLILRN
jgi:hypothetical protein